MSLTPLGVELPLGVMMTGSQQTFVQTPTPSVATDSDGNFVAVWANSAHDGSGWGVFAQRFDSDGVPLGDPIGVNVETESDQTYPGVAMDDDGNFVVTWSSLGQDRDGYGIYVRRFDAAGEPASGEYRVNTHTTGNQVFSAVAMDADGDFVITWTSQGQDGSGTGIFAQRFKSTGGFDGDEFQVNTTSAGNQRFSSVAMADDGQFLVTWTGLDGSGNGIFARHFDAAGTPGGDEFRVNTIADWSQQYSAVAIGASGHCVVAWESFDPETSNWNVVAQRFDPSGTRLGGETVLDEGRHASVTVGPSADFVVAWETYDSEHVEPSGVHVQHYDANGEALGEPLEAQSVYGFDQFSPSVVMTGDRMLLFWTSDGADGTEVVTVPSAVTPDDVVNQPPTLTPIEDQTISEGETLTLQAIATDADVPADALAFRLAATAPEGAWIDPVTGEFSWTPSEEQGPATHVISVQVIDSGLPELGDQMSFTVTVLEVNQPPVIEPIDDESIDLGE
ncbi:MAG TPA: putative Ig domain-containing protein, partial [Thermoguttaceae bacterium]|nr:putative Ig domain-containing protein [Thermoguttaceae bacterium]